jgi:hypothetical protein
MADIVESVNAACGEEGPERGKWHLKEPQAKAVAPEEEADLSAKDDSRGGETAVIQSR